MLLPVIQQWAKRGDVAVPALGQKGCYGSDSAALIARPARPDFLRKRTRTRAEQLRCADHFPRWSAWALHVRRSLSGRASFRSWIPFRRYVDALSLTSGLMIAEPMFVQCADCHDCATPLPMIVDRAKRRHTSGPMKLRRSCGPAPNPGDIHMPAVQAGKPEFSSSGCI